MADEDTNLLQTPAPDWYTAAVQHQRRWGSPAAADQIADIITKTMQIPLDAAMQGPRFMQRYMEGNVAPEDAGPEAFRTALGLVGGASPFAVRGAVGAAGGKATAVDMDLFMQQLEDHLTGKPAAPVGSAPGSYVPTKPKVSLSPGVDKFEQIPYPYSSSEWNSLKEKSTSLNPAAPPYWNKKHNWTLEDGKKLSEDSPELNDAWRESGSPGEQLPASRTVSGNPLERAKQLGYTTEVYRGMKSPHEGRGAESQGYSEFYTAAHPDVAGLYAGVPEKYTKSGRIPDHTLPEGANVMPLRLNTSNYHEVDAQHSTWTDDGGLLMLEALRQAKKHDKDGVIVRNIYDEPAGDTTKLGHSTDVYIPLKGSTVRSKFADFDPSRIHLNNLLAGLGGVAVASGVAHTVIHGADNRLHSIHPMPEGFDPFEGGTEQGDHLNVLL